MRRGGATTLVELMIVVSLVGILAGTLSVAASEQRAAGLGELQREQAAQILEYYADCLSSGRKPEGDVFNRLSEGLPSADVRIERQGQLATITVLWKARNQFAQKRSLSVFAHGAR